MRTSRGLHIQITHWSDSAGKKYVLIGASAGGGFVNTIPGGGALLGVRGTASVAGGAGVAGGAIGAGAAGVSVDPEAFPLSAGRGVSVEAGRSSMYSCICLAAILLPYCSSAM